MIKYVPVLGRTDCKYISNIEMNGGKIVYVPIRPPAAKETHSASDWTLDIDELRSKCTERTKMIVLNTPHNPLGKMFSKEELDAIGKVAIEKDLIIVSDEVVFRSIFSKFNMSSMID